VSANEPKYITNASTMHRLK